MNKKNRLMNDVMTQFIHDISNIVQNMMIASYERQIGGNSMTKIDRGLFELKKLIEIYRSAFLEAEILEYHKFEQIIEDLNFLYDRQIELEEESLSDESSQNSILEVMSVYAIWISKNDEILKIHCKPNIGYLELKKPRDLEQYVRTSDLCLKRIIDQICKFNNLIIYPDMKTGRIYIEAQPFDFSK